jgi:hypothetical protein
LARFAERFTGHGMPRPDGSKEDADWFCSGGLQAGGFSSAQRKNSTPPA